MSDLLRPRRLVSPLLDLVCRAEKSTLMSPSGEIEAFVCEGWCGYWRVESHGLYAQGWRLKHSDMRPYVERLVVLLRRDLHLQAASELEGVLNAWDAA